MHKNKQSRIQTGASIAFIFLSIIVMYIAHKEMYFTMDDDWYATLLYSEEPITSFSDIVKSQIWHYNNWGGRSMTHGLLQMIILAGEGFADVLNVIVTLLLAGMVCLVADDKKLPAFFTALAMIIGLNANWKMSMFWQSGAANYLYITVVILAYLYCYLHEDKKLYGITLWMIPLGLVTGWSNENMGPSAWVVATIICVLTYKSKHRIPLWMILGNVSCLAGSALCILAPGNFVRSEQVEANQYGALWQLFLRVYAEGKAALEYLFPIIIVVAFLVMISKGIYQIALGRNRILLLLCALLSWGAMVLSPHYPDRATFGTQLLLVCVAVSLIKDICAKQKELTIPLFGMSVLIWLRGMFFLGEFLATCWGWIR